ncbi:uncharacterized protein CCOS01_02539 [Colletotrichum costaricense]|uniref:Uncharacterized protein n=1 Tax=Colletotrichum costaricense TaxID=1209916 RepID=A0AAJ0E5D5_9PEZI|nr:uncharacterized protein CCOS01_02539 [Colletotrichum costaricense]KAK1537219.1 hypothetical protein CCOS01_02539 [Colletotrichum costaricense]
MTCYFVLLGVLGLRESGKAAGARSCFTCLPEILLDTRKRC